MAKKKHNNKMALLLKWCHIYDMVLTKRAIDRTARIRPIKIHTSQFEILNYDAVKTFKFSIPV
jgi:hypothetical protein